MFTYPILGATGAVIPIPTTNLISWLDASDNSTMWQDVAKTTPVTTIGQTIAYWADKNGSGNDWVQGTAAARPTWMGTYVRFQLDWLTGPNLSAKTAGTLGLRVHTIDDEGTGGFGGDGGWFYLSSDISTNSTSHWAYTENANYSSFMNLSRPGTFTWSTIPEAWNDKLTYVNTYGSGILKARVNGTERHNAAATPGTMGSLPAIGMSVRNTVYSDAFALGDGYLYAMVLYDSVLTGTDLTDMESYLASL